MDELTRSLFVRVTATALFVLAMGWLVANGRRALAAIAISMPVVIGPSFFMLALDREASFVLRTAENALGALTGTIAFAVLVVRLAGRQGRVTVIASALLLWAAMVALAGFASGWAANAAIFAIAYGVGMSYLKEEIVPENLPVKWVPGAAIIRALAAGVLVGAVTLAAEQLGAALSATLIALPVGMIFVAAWTLKAAPPEAARQVMAAGARGTAALAVFLVVVRAMPKLGVSVVAAVAVATIASVALAALLSSRPRDHKT